METSSRVAATVSAPPVERSRPPALDWVPGLVMVLMSVELAWRLAHPAEGSLEALIARSIDQAFSEFAKEMAS
jgi:hypothetical protein